MQSEKVLTMPNRLRRDENPPYPEYAVAILQSALDMHQDVGEMKSAVRMLEATQRQHGDKLDAVGKDLHAAKTTIRVLVGLIIAAAGVIGWAVTTYVNLRPAK